METTKTSRRDAGIAAHRAAVAAQEATYRAKVEAADKPINWGADETLDIGRN